MGRRGATGKKGVLLIPFGPGVGDAVMMEPLIRAVRRSFPDLDLTMVARKHAGEILRADDYEIVSPFYFVERAPAPLKPLHRLIPQRYIAWAAEPAMHLDLGPFDRVINLFWVWESRLPFDRWWTPRWPPIGGVRHTVDLLADFLEGDLGTRIPYADRLPRLELFPEAGAWGEAYVSRRVKGQRLASFVVCSANPLKWWAASRWIELNDRMAGLGWRTLIVAPRNDIHARQIYAGCRARPLWPAVDLRRAAALLGQSDVVVGIDTGPLHVASALGVPWVGLFGPTNPDVIGPYDRSKGKPLVARFGKAASCADCWRAFKNREEACPTLPSSGCTTMVTVEEAMGAVREVADGIRFASVSSNVRHIQDDKKRSA